MNDNNLFLNIEIVSGFLMLSSKLDQSFKVEGKKLVFGYFLC